MPPAGANSEGDASNAEGCTEGDPAGSGDEAETPSAKDEEQEGVDEEENDNHDMPQVEDANDATGE